MTREEAYLAIVEGWLRDNRGIVFTEGAVDDLCDRIASMCFAKARDNARLRAERDQWNADARRLSGGLMAIRGADETVPASVLRSVAYDIALNCIEPDVAAYQITRRALEPKP